MCLKRYYSRATSRHVFKTILF